MNEKWFLCGGAHSLGNFQRDNVYEDFLQVGGKCGVTLNLPVPKALCP